MKTWEAMQKFLKPKVKHRSYGTPKRKSPRIRAKTMKEIPNPNPLIPK